MALPEESARSSLPMAELIRRAVDSVYRPASRLRVGGVDLNVGIFSEPDAALVGRRGLRRKRS